MLQILMIFSQASVNMFQELDERINYVATKVLHLGDQLESVNTPRARAVEAQKLMNHFAEFLSPGPLLAEVFTDKARVTLNCDCVIIKAVYFCTFCFPHFRYILK
jgi:Exocyst complex component Sec10.